MTSRLSDLVCCLCGSDGIRVARYADDDISLDCPDQFCADRGGRGVSTEEYDRLCDEREAAKKEAS